MNVLCGVEEFGDLAVHEASSANDSLADYIILHGR